MSGHRIDRINEDIKRELSAIFRTLKDPRISSMITVLRVEVTNDLSYATIHVSTIEGEDKTAESVKAILSDIEAIRGANYLDAVRRAAESDAIVVTVEKN